jgi:phage-related protein
VFSTDWTLTTGSRCRRSALGVREIRIHVEGEHRAFYEVARAEAIPSSTGFEKTTQKTSARDLEIGRERYCAIATLG